MNMLKNKFYVIYTSDNSNAKIYLRTKIDFYTEGFNTLTSEVYQGYNYFSKSIKLISLNGSRVNSPSGNEGICIYDGFTSLGRFYSDYVFIPDSDDNLKCYIVEVQEQEEIDKINSIIDSELKRINSQEKEFYKSQKSKRSYYFNEFKSNLVEPCMTSEGIIIPIEQMDSFTMDDLMQIQNYINSFSSAKTVSKNGRDEYGNKVRKRKSKHNKK